MQVSSSHMEELRSQLAKIADAFEKHGYDDLVHFAEIAATLKRIEITQQEQGVILEPIRETFQTTTTLGKWLMPLLVAVSLGVGIVWGIIQIITKP